VIPRYRLLAERLSVELRSVEKLVGRAEEALSRSVRQRQDQEFFVASAAFDLHGFYSGLERLFELIANEIDESRPTSASWHRDLLTQMSLAVTDVRPAVLSTETVLALTDYLEFRHVVRNMYTFNLRFERVVELVHGLRPVFETVQRDLQTFVEYLQELSTSDEGDA
jgi:hypothetical protein